MDPWNVAGGQNRAAGYQRRKAASMLGSLTAIVGIMVASALPAAADGAVRKQADFNGDGYADLAVGAPGEDYRVFTGTGYYYDLADAGVVQVTYGAPSGLSYGRNQVLSRATEPLGSLNMPVAGHRFGRALAWGDFNRDGFDDLAVGGPGNDRYPGAVDIYYGSPNGLPNRAGLFLTLDKMPSPPYIVNGRYYYFGDSLAAGDVNKDGYADLAISQYLNGGVNRGRAYLIYGTATGLDPSHNAQNINSATNLGPNSLAMGDFNGDGYFDLAKGFFYQNVSGQHSAGMVHVLYGGPYGLGLAQVWNQDSPNIHGACEPYDGFGSSLAAADFNDDGKWDLAVGAPGENSYAGVVHIIFGQSSGLDSWANQIWDQNSPYVGDVPEANDGFGASLAAAVLNHDRFPELIVGIPGENSGVGAIQVITVIVSRAGQAEQYWDQDGYQIQDQVEAGDRFGSYLSVGDFDGNGRHDVAIGVPGENAWAGCVTALYGVGSGLSWPNNQFLMQGFQATLEWAENGDNFGVL